MNATGTWPDAVHWSCPVPFPDGAEQLSERLYGMISLPLCAQHGASTAMLTIGVLCPGGVCPGVVYPLWHQMALGCPPGMWL